MTEDQMKRNETLAVNHFLGILENSSWYKSLEDGEHKTLIKMHIAQIIEGAYSTGVYDILKELNAMEEIAMIKKENKEDD
jgi:hypothetical protein